MKIAVPKEINHEESRIAATPETVKKLVRAGFSVSFESGAGVLANHPDSEFETAGAKIVANSEAVYRETDIILKVRKPSLAELDLIRDSAICLSFVRPLKPASEEWFKKITAKNISYFAMELVPRIARAQKLDALSSQASVAGYKAVLLASHVSGKLFPMMVTAAGTVQPAKVLVIGAGVAGLQAIATAKRLGAVVEAFDTRVAAKEQVESVGGRFLQLEIEESTEDSRGYATEVSKKTHRSELALIAKHAKAADIVITTALIPGRPAPVLIPEEIVKQMKPGSVIVDLAAERGGNCPLSEPDRETEKHGVKILGYTNLPGMMAYEASQLYARNVMNLVLEFWKKGSFAIDLSDEVAKQTLLCHQGKSVSPVVQEAVQKGTEI